MRIPRWIKRYVLLLVAVLAAAALVNCDEAPNTTDGLYIPPPVKGDDGRRLLWKPKGTRENPEEKQCYEPDFSPDASKVVVSYRDGRWGRDADLAILDCATRDLNIILSGNGARRPSWSPSGRWIAYQDYDDSTIWLVRPDGSDNHRLDIPRSAYSPIWGGTDERVYLVTAMVEPRNADAAYYDLEKRELVLVHHLDELYSGHGRVIPGPEDDIVAVSVLNTIRKEPLGAVLAFVDSDGSNYTRVCYKTKYEWGGPLLLVILITRGNTVTPFTSTTLKTAP
jgi:dipeptidyl aminopeptidase/acylaminoacyl peptidase